jgi:hypothetical protein
MVVCEVIRAAELVGDKFVSVVDAGVELVAVQGIRDQVVIEGGIGTKVRSVTQLINTNCLIMPIV